MSEISLLQNDILQIKMGLKLLTACCSFANCCAMYCGLYQPVCQWFYQFFSSTKLTIELRLQHLWKFLTTSAKRQFLCCSSEPQEKLKFLSWNPFSSFWEIRFQAARFLLDPIDQFASLSKCNMLSISMAYVGVNLVMQRIPSWKQFSKYIFLCFFREKFMQIWEAACSGRGFILCPGCL